MLPGRIHEEYEQSSLLIHIRDRIGRSMKMALFTPVPDWVLAEPVHPPVFSIVNIRLSRN